MLDRGGGGTGAPVFGASLFSIIGAMIARAFGQRQGRDGTRHRDDIR
jgi:hypothetical protein